ncbi:hypothetical protein AAC387_Pa09g0706 [Persea americana]
MSLLDLPLHLNQLNQIHALIITKNCNATSFIKRLLNISTINYGRILLDEIPQTDQNLGNSVVSTYS